MNKDMHVVVMSHDIQEEVVAAVQKHFGPFLEEVRKSIYSSPTTKQMSKRAKATGLNGFLDPQLIMETGKEISRLSTNMMAACHADFAEELLKVLNKISEDYQNDD